MSSSILLRVSLGRFVDLLVQYLNVIDLSPLNEVHFSFTSTVLPLVSGRSLSLKATIPEALGPLVVLPLWWNVSSYGLALLSATRFTRCGCLSPQRVRKRRVR